MMMNPMIFFEKCRRTAVVWGTGVCVLAGCHKHYYVEVPAQPEEKPVETTLSLSTEELVFEAAGGWRELVVSCNADWMLAGGGEWCQPGATIGSGNLQVQVRAESYEGREDRNTLLVVKAGGLTKVLTVTQKCPDALTVTTDKFYVPQEGKDIVVEIKGHFDYEVVIPEAFREWITKGSGETEGGKLRFTIAANEDTDSREGYIFIESNGVRETVYVYQAQYDYLILSKKEYELSDEKQEIEVELRTNVDYEVVVPDSVKGWVSCPPESRALRTDRFRLVVEENEGADGRRAVVIVKDKNSELSDTLRIRQEGVPETPEGVFSKTEYEFVYQGGSINIEFTVPTAWQALINYEGEDSGWLTIDVIAGEAGEVKLSMSAAKNPLEAIRKAYVNIKYGSRTQSLIVSQEANKDGIDITADFNSEFAKVLEKRGYIKSATHITLGDVNEITEINVSNAGLTYLYGIEYFAALTSCYCYGNRLNVLDVSKNTVLITLDCSDNTLLKKLDVSQNTALTTLNCSNDQLTMLNVSGCTALTRLDCSRNELVGLNVSQNTALTYLNCRTNKLTKLDVSKNTALKTLDCSGNPGDGDRSFPLIITKTIEANLSISEKWWWQSGRQMFILTQYQ